MLTTEYLFVKLRLDQLLCVTDSLALISAGGGWNDELCRVSQADHRSLLPGGTRPVRHRLSLPVLDTAVFASTPTFCGLSLGLGT